MRVLIVLIFCFLSFKSMATENPLMEKMPLSQSLLPVEQNRLDIRAYPALKVDSNYKRKAKSPGDLLESAGRNYTLARIISLASATIFIIAVSDKSNPSSKAAQNNATLTLIGGEIAALVFNFIATNRLKQAGRALNAQERQKRTSY